MKQMNHIVHNQTNTTHLLNNNINYGILLTTKNSMAINYVHKTITVKPNIGLVAYSVVTGLSKNGDNVLLLKSII